MKKAFTIAAAALALASFAPVSLAPADAAMMAKRVTVHTGPMGHTCRKIVTTKRAHGNVMRMVRRVCN